MKLDLGSLRSAYSAGLTPAVVVEHVYALIEKRGLRPTWISLVPRERAQQRAAELETTDQKALPLYGVPFAVKDNIDVVGMETTAGCPAYAYQPRQNATVVTQLEAAGAILIGKTNMDQFATGLVGVRSPYGASSSVFHHEYVSGGSSSGSAVAVSSGLVSFALGTDTAGSGRVPAALNNLVGLKPTRGAISNSGVVPACRSLDCVSIFALTCGDAKTILEQARGFDPSDIYSRAEASLDGPAPWLSSRTPFRFGVPHEDQWEFFGDEAARTLYVRSIHGLEALGGKRISFDFAPFRAAAELLYSGPWVAERLAALEAFVSAHAAEMHPVVRQIIQGGSKYTAVDSFNAQYRLNELQRVIEPTWQDLDVLLLPTIPTAYKIADVEKDPIRLNSNLGYYTNFVNLLDLAAVSLPAGFRPNGLPFGVSLIGRASTDAGLLHLSDRLHRALNERIGNVDPLLVETAPLAAPVSPPGCTLVAVVGAHLTGQPLNWQLTSRGALLVKTTRTAPSYRFYALSGATPPKPGLIREPGFTGPGIEVEVWAIPMEHLGSFVALIAPPLGIGTLELADGGRVQGFICEPYAVADAKEITELSGWRAHLALDSGVARV